jgi:transposase-like protein
MFAGRRFDREVILLCVRWYLRYKLSLRDLVEMMAERELDLAHTTIMRWVLRYVPKFEKSWARYARKVRRSWPSDIYASKAKLRPLSGIRSSLRRINPAHRKYCTRALKIDFSRF